MLFSGDNVNEIEAEIIELVKNIRKIGTTIRFADGEASVQINEEELLKYTPRDDIVIVLQSIVSDNALMSLLVMIDGLKRYGVNEIVGVVTYFGYARQDRQFGNFSPISARLVAKSLELAGVSRIVTIDLHNESIAGFFDIPVLNILPTSLFADDIKNRNRYPQLDNVVIVAPDIGSCKRARELANQLNKNDIVVVDKYRAGAGISEVMNIIGNVKGKNCIITDDIIDSAGTLCNAAKALKENGAQSVDAYVTHGILAGRTCNISEGRAIIKIDESELDNITITNSVNYPVGDGIKYYSTDNRRLISKKIKVISISKLITREIEDLYEKKYNGKINYAFKK